VIPGETTPRFDAALAALGVTAVLSEFMRRTALRHGFVDRPAHHKAHQHPTPYLGGIAIAVGTLLPTAFLVPDQDHRLGAVISGAAVVAILGLVDDIRPLGLSTRLLTECAASALVVQAGAELHVFGGDVDAVMTTAWIVVVTNSFNLIDNMDGAAATVGLATTGLLAVTAYTCGQAGVAVLALALCAGCAGFLIHNWPPARLFIGDSGSLFIGFMITSLTALAYSRSHGATAITGAWLATFIPTIDTGIVLISRHRAGRPHFSGGTDHVAHRLRRLGMSVPRTNAALFVSAAMTSLIGLGLAQRRLPSLAVLSTTALVTVGLAWSLLQVPIYSARQLPGIATPPEVEA
jgi:UDP-GlcNAc:undecaprenyl-phosphate GlcNAc-1-phosphate transferase